MGLIVTLVVLCIVGGLAWWIVMQIPGMGDSWIVRVVFGLVALLIILSLFTGYLPLVPLQR